MVGCYGEVIETEAHKEFLRLINRMGIPENLLETIISKASYLHQQPPYEKDAGKKQSIIVASIVI